MKSAIFSTVLGLSTLLASAAPVDEILKRAQPVRRSYVPSGVVSTGFSSATGTAAVASGTASAYYHVGTGSTCAPNGAVICSGESQFGICNWGKVTFQPVAAGTKCVDGAIVLA